MTSANGHVVDHVLGHAILTERPTTDSSPICPSIFVLQFTGQIYGETPSFSICNMRKEKSLKF